MNIKRQIVIIIAITLSLISVIICVGFQNEKKFEDSKLCDFQKNQLIFVRQVSERVGTNFVKLHDALYSLSQMPEIQFMSKNRSLLNMIRVFKMNKNLVEGIFRVDNENQLQLAYPNNSIAIHKDELQPIFHHARMTGESLFKVIRRSQDQQDVLIIARPIYTVQGDEHLNPSNTFSGLIYFTISLATLQEKLLGDYVFSKSGYPMILDEKGALIVTKKPAYAVNNIFEIFPAQDSSSAPKRSFQNIFKKIFSKEKEENNSAKIPYLDYREERNSVLLQEEGWTYSFDQKSEDIEKKLTNLIAFTKLYLPYQTWYVAAINPKNEATLSVDKAIKERWFYSMAFLTTVLGVSSLLIVLIIRTHKDQMQILCDKEEALQKAELKYRTLVEQSSDAILILKQGETIYANPAYLKLIGSTESKDIEHSFFDRIVPEDRIWISEYYQNQLNGGFIKKQYELRISTLNGEKVSLEIRPSIIQYQNECVTMLSMRDTTERKKIEETLRNAKEAAENASRAKSDFLANMSHELRTPLNHIIGFTDLVLEKHFGELNELQEEYLNDVVSSSKHLLAVINDVLDLSKIEADKMELSLSDVNLKQLLENSLIMVKEKALRHNINLSLHIDSVPDAISVDERKFKQILYNLLSNGMKFTPDGGSVTISCEKADADSVEISVVDTGIGIDPRDQARIFLAFEQVDSSTNRKYQGTGLGLPLTKRLVEIHGGKIWVESEGEGRGSAFRFIIPNNQNIRG